MCLLKACYLERSRWCHWDFDFVLDSTPAVYASRMHMLTHQFVYWTLTTIEYKHIDARNTRLRAILCGCMWKCAAKMSIQKKLKWINSNIFAHKHTHTHNSQFELDAHEIRSEIECANDIFRSFQCSMFSCLVCQPVREEHFSTEANNLPNISAVAWLCSIILYFFSIYTSFVIDERVWLCL